MNGYAWECTGYYLAFTGAAVAFANYMAPFFVAAIDPLAGDEALAMPQAIAAILAMLGAAYKLADCLDEHDRAREAAELRRRAAAWQAEVERLKRR